MTVQLYLHINHNSGEANGASHLRHCHSDRPSVILNVAPTPTVILNAAKRSEESKVTALIQAKVNLLPTSCHLVPFVDQT